MGPFSFTNEILDFRIFQQSKVCRIALNFNPMTIGTGGSWAYAKNKLSVGVIYPFSDNGRSLSLMLSVTRHTKLTLLNDASMKMPYRVARVGSKLFKTMTTHTFFKRWTFKCLMTLGTLFDIRMIAT